MQTLSTRWTPRGVAAARRVLRPGAGPRGLSLSLLTLNLTLSLSAGCGPDGGLPEAAEARSTLYVSAGQRWPGATVPVCWESLGAAADLAVASERALVRTAVEETWQGVAGVRFTGWGPCAAASRGVRIRSRDSGPYTLGLGTELDGVKDGMVLNFTFTTWSPGCQRTRPYCIRVGAVHEFGHALGFAHEQNRADTPSWCTSEQGKDGDVTIGAWDLDSVMNYCNPRWTGDGQLSATDIEGAVAAYGTGGGDWQVARSDGRAFAEPLRSRDERSRGADADLLGDVTGDGRADAVVVWSATGEWWVAPALSGGGADAGRFGPLARWASGAGKGATRYLLGDVTGDGRADAVAFLDATGGWWVAPALAAGGFDTAALWKSGHGSGSSAQLLGDVTGDGRADAVAFFDATGSWWVAPALATGSGFGPYSLWKSGHGAGSSAQLLGDATGDGRADALAAFAGRGTVWIAPSTGSAFAAYALWREHLGTALSPDLVRLLLGDTDGDGKADAVARWLR
ncbi:MAG: peptidase M12A astacin [Polyangia bacterium]